MKMNQNNSNNSRGGFGIQRIVGTIISIIDLILVLRFILKLFGANAGNSIVQGLYDITQPFIGLFEGIFSSMKTNLFGMSGVFEPATVIAIIIVGLIGAVLLKLISTGSGRRSSGY
jgi:hypothetical protein